MAEKKGYPYKTKTACTQEEFDADIKGNTYATCDMPDGEIFYFVFGEPSPSRPDRHRVYITFYDKEGGIRYSNKSCGFSAEKSGALGVIEPLGYTHFLIMEQGCQNLVVLSDDWSSATYTRLDAGVLEALGAVARKYNADTQTSIQKTGLSRLREGSEGDFRLKSREGDEIKVHKAVMAPLWPFFQGLLDSKMKEASDNVVELDTTKSTLEVIVRYLYGQELELTFPDAARLLVAAQMYDLPELLKIAVEKVISFNMDIEQAIMAWRLAFEAKNEKVQHHCAAKVHALMSMCTDFSQEVDDLSKEEIQQLFHDVSLSMARA